MNWNLNRKTYLLVFAFCISHLWGNPEMKQHHISWVWETLSTKAQFLFYVMFSLLPNKHGDPNNSLHVITRIQIISGLQTTGVEESVRGKQSQRIYHFSLCPGTATGEGQTLVPSCSEKEPISLPTQIHVHSFVFYFIYFVFLYILFYIYIYIFILYISYFILYLYFLHFRDTRQFSQQ